MAEKQGVSDLYKKNAEKAGKDKRLRDAVSLFFILFGSVIVAVNLNRGSWFRAVFPDSPS